MCEEVLDRAAKAAARGAAYVSSREFDHGAQVAARLCRSLFF
jgi:hypothetical protein